jgi:two-component system response regulator (stage 0 sporulation protein A)
MSALEKKADILWRIDQVLCDLGIPDNLRGFDYLQTAIEVSLQNPDAIHSMTIFLYPVVAVCYDTRPDLVERSMRHAIECGWSRCDLRMQEKYFGGKVDPKRCKPKNSEFIARVANIVRWQCMEEKNSELTNYGCVV